jgi:thiamine-phosphate pyrophosphorylase
VRRPFDLSLYLVTDRALSAGRPLEKIIEEAVQGGATMVQLREKDIPTREFLDLARRLKSLLAPRGIPLIINDRLDIALASGADGIHVGQSDMPVPEIRRLGGPELLIGLSVESEEDARDAEKLDIDYIGISPVYTTPTKKELTRGLGPEGVRSICSLSRFPAVGIGGLNHTNSAEVIRSGAEGVAVVSALCSAESPEKAAQSLSKLIRIAKDQRRQA